jgi:hypothetical protein
VHRRSARLIPLSLGQASGEPARPLLTDLLAELSVAKEIASRFAADSDDERSRIEAILMSTESFASLES